MFQNKRMVCMAVAICMCIVSLATAGSYTARVTWGKTPFNLTIERFTLTDRSGAAVWSTEHFGQNAYWVSRAGQVVALRSPGDEGLPGTLSFYDVRGNIVREVPVRGFSGGQFCGDGGQFFACDLANGLSAYDYSGIRLWSLPLGNAFEPSANGSTIAIARGNAIAIIVNGVFKYSIAWDGDPVRMMAFSENGSSLAAISGDIMAVYGLEHGEKLWQRTPSTPGQKFNALASCSGGFTTTAMDRAGNASDCQWAGDGTAEKVRDYTVNIPPRAVASLPKHYGAFWPLAPIDQVHPIGNGWGEYQGYGGYPPYFHPGIDVMAQPYSGVPVYAVAHGWVKAWLTTEARYHWRLAIADSSKDWADSSDGWLYAHIDPARPHLNEGEEVYPGDWIGYVVDWGGTGFDHCHFARIRDAGGTWGISGADWKFIEDPLNFITPNTDTSRPVIEDALPGSRFAFCVDNRDTYLDPGNLHGDVDIVACVYDRFGQTVIFPESERLNPYRIDYAIKGQTKSQPKRLSFLFGHRLDGVLDAPDEVGLIKAVFALDTTCQTVNSRYYYIVTNTDGDSLLEISDTSGAWHTNSFPNGQYWVIITATDQYGNATSDSQQVAVNNPVDHAGVCGASPAVAGRIRLTAGPNPFRERISINFQTARDGEATVSIYNSAGQLVRTIGCGFLRQGDHAVSWDGRDRAGRPAASGCYLVQIKTGTTIVNRKVLRIQ